MARSWHTVESLALGGSRAISSPHDREGGKHEQKGRALAVRGQVWCPIAVTFSEAHRLGEAGRVEQLVKEQGGGSFAKWPVSVLGLQTHPQGAVMSTFAL